MSWQQYIDSSLLGTGYVSKGAIIGHDGSTWATSAGFTVTPAEGKAIVAGINNSDSLAATGIKIADVKYMFIRADSGRSIYGRKGGDAGCVCVKTNQAVVIAVYEGGIQPGSCANVVEKLADYLISVSY